MESTTSKRKEAFLQGGGEMGEIIRRYDWANSPLGTPDQWPQSLRTTLGLLLHSSFPMFLFWGKELTCFYNDAFRPSLGMEGEGKHPAIGKPGKEVWAEIMDFIGPLLNKVMNTGEPVWFEDQLVPFYRNGRMEDIYWTFSYSPAYGDDGTVEGVFVTCTETTDKIRSISQLQSMNQQFQDLVMQAPVAIAVFRGDDFVAEIANEAYLPIVGKTKEEFIGKPLFESLPETREVLEPIARELVRSGKPYPASEFELVIHRHGREETCYFNSVWEPLHETDGSVNGFIVVAHEITDQVNARKKAEQSEEKFRSLIHEAPIATCLFVGKEMHIEVANEIMIGYWGKDQTVIGKPVAEAIPELKGQPFLEILDKVFTTGQPHHEEDAEALLMVDGELRKFYFDYTYQPVHNAKGEVYGVMDMAIDVTEQVKARQQIMEAEERVRLAINSADLGTYELNFATGQMQTSERFDMIFGVRESSERDKLVARIHPEDREIRQKAHEESLKTGNLDYEARVVWDDLSEHWIRVKGTVFFDAQHQPSTLIGVVQDITEQKLFAEQLTRQVRERTAELEIKNKELERSNAHLEEFAHAASHDLKEPIRKVHFFTDRLKNQLGDRLNDEDLRLFGRIENATLRMSALIDDLLLYSHVSNRPLEMESINLNEKLSKVLDDLELDIQQKEAVVKVGELPVVRGYRRQLQQLFQNLISNALKYSRAGVPPVISIDSRLINREEAGIHLPAGSKISEYHLITIKDNGIGFEQSEADRIFQMFQRLHGNAEFPGTGIGLAIARKVVENHNGFIYAESQPGAGSTFYIGLPAE